VGSWHSTAELLPLFFVPRADSEQITFQRRSLSPHCLPFTQRSNRKTNSSARHHPSLNSSLHGNIAYHKRLLVE
jgi:hypothetical protein